MKEKLDKVLVFQQEFMSMRDVFMMGHVYLILTHHSYILEVTIFSSYLFFVSFEIGRIHFY